MIGDDVSLLLVLPWLKMAMLWAAIVVNLTVWQISEYTTLFARPPIRPSASLQHMTLNTSLKSSSSDQWPPDTSDIGTMVVLQQKITFHGKRRNSKSNSFLFLKHYYFFIYKDTLGYKFRKLNLTYLSTFVCLWDICWPKFQNVNS